MKMIEAHARLLQMQHAVFTTADATAHLGLCGATVSMMLGDYMNGLSYSLYLCRTDWTLIATLHMIGLADGAAPIWLKPHPDTGEMAVANCLEGYPKEPAYAYTNVYVNYPPDSPECAGVGTSSSSWGAIKAEMK